MLTSLRRIGRRKKEARELDSRAFRKQGKPRLFVYRTFIASVVLLLKYARLKKISKVIIDEEYFGKDKMLKSMFLEMWSRFFTEIPEVSFERIGKKSKVHSVCYLTMKGKYKADKVLEFEEIKQLALR